MASCGSPGPPGRGQRTAFALEGQKPQDTRACMLLPGRVIVKKRLRPKPATPLVSSMGVGRASGLLPSGVLWCSFPCTRAGGIANILQLTTSSKKTGRTRTATLTHPTSTSQPIDQPKEAARKSTVKEKKPAHGVRGVGAQLPSGSLTRSLEQSNGTT
jgi:hypothetical protein